VLDFTKTVLNRDASAKSVRKKVKSIMRPENKAIYGTLIM